MDGAGEVVLVELGLGEHLRELGSLVPNQPLHLVAIDVLWHPAILTKNHPVTRGAVAETARRTDTDPWKEVAAPDA